MGRRWRNNHRGKGSAVGRKKRDLRLDILPESYPYRDDGCEVSPSCLRCPLPVCKYDDPGRERREARDRRDSEIREAHEQERLSPTELARRFGVSPRTVFRAVRRGRARARVGGLKDY